MKIEEMYMKIVETHDKIVNIRGELDCTPQKCSDCEYFIVCNSLGIASSALKMAASHIENY